MTVTHPLLVARAIQYLRTVRACHVVLSEMQCNWIESPDAIGFSRRFSILVEAKTSRADFARDIQKKARRPGVGMGAYRYYLVPKGLVRRHECNGFNSELKTDEGWGLLWWHESTGRISVEKPSMRFSVNERAENLFLVSALQRVQLRLTSPLHEYIRWAQSPIVQRAKEDDNVAMAILGADPGANPRV